MIFQRGSRRHILDWLELGTEPFRASLNQFLAGCGAEVGETNIWMPIDHDSPREARLGSDHLGVLTNDIQRKLTDWWLVHRSGANTPNWDLAAGASFNGRNGLVLFEAKAHEGELETGGKRPWINDRGKHNHKRIGMAIQEANRALERIVPGIRISRDSYYQVSNRIAFAWKLSSLGVPVILVYLGFLKDAGMAQPFNDEAHILDYLSAVFPTAFLGKSIDCGSAPMQIIIRSRPVLSPSPPPVTRKSQTTYDKIKDQIVAKQK